METKESFTSGFSSPGAIIGGVTVREIVRAAQIYSDVNGFADREHAERVTIAMIVQYQSS